MADVLAREGSSPVRGERPLHEVADIFRAHGAEYRKSHCLSDEQWQAMWAIEHCRTLTLGGHVDVCSSCDHEEISYNSCRNRHCPKCQALAQARWLEARKSRVLPVPYFHVVFTLPAPLRPLARRNPRLVYDILFSSASRTLLELGRNSKWLGGQLAVTAVLHTWARDLSYHPHLHCVVSGGGLNEDGTKWIAGDPRYLFPVLVLSQLFRGKFMAELERAYSKGKLDIGSDDPQEFERLRGVLFAMNWVVYAKRPFAGPGQIFEYLGRYTHRVGISNHRLLHVDKDRVDFVTRGDGVATLHPLEFIRRFLQHILPKSFVKIRHYGLVASSNVASRLEQALRLLGAPSTEKDVPADWRDLLAALTGIDMRRCPICGTGLMYRAPDTDRHPAVRACRAPPPNPQSNLQ